MGRSVAAIGYWGDIVNSPHHCFGAVCKGTSMFKQANMAFEKTAVDVAERNLQVSHTDFFERNSICFRLLRPQTLV